MNNEINRTSTVDFRTESVLNLGNIKLICNKKRIIGKSICGLITTYLLVIIPTLLYFIIS